MSAEIQLVSPFPGRDYHLLWSWLHEFPLNNFDDTGPTSLAALAVEIGRRRDAGETILEVVYAGQPIGVIGFASISSDCAALHGIAFAKSTHGSGVPRAAVSMAFEKVFAAGIKSIVGAHFSDNIGIGKFLAKLGARETYGHRHFVPRGGIMVEKILFSIDPVDFRNAQTRSLVGVA